MKWRIKINNFLKKLKHLNKCANLFVCEYENINMFFFMIFKYFDVLIFILFQLIMLQFEQWFFQMIFFHVIFIIVEIAIWRNFISHRKKFRIDENERIKLSKSMNLGLKNYDYERYNWISNDNEFTIKKRMILFTMIIKNWFLRIFLFLFFESNKLIVFAKNMYW